MQYTVIIWVSHAVRGAYSQHSAPVNHICLFLCHGWKKVMRCVHGCWLYCSDSCVLITHPLFMDARADKPFLTCIAKVMSSSARGKFVFETKVEPCDSLRKKQCITICKGKTMWYNLIQYVTVVIVFISLHWDLVKDSNWQEFGFLAREKLAAKSFQWQQC